MRPCRDVGLTTPTFQSVILRLAISYGRIPCSCIKCNEVQKILPLLSLFMPGILSESKPSKSWKAQGGWVDIDANRDAEKVHLETFLDRQ